MNVQIRNILAICLWEFCSASAQIIPTDRVYNWSTNTVGVPGGIPNRTTIFTNMTLLDNTGATNVSAEINAAVVSCPSNQVVYLPAGTYRISSKIVFADNRDFKTLRGAGMGTTILLSYVTATTGTIELGSQEWPPPAYTITVSSGATAGSTNITVDTLGTVKLNRMIRIGQYDPDYVRKYNGSTNNQHSMHLVTATNATSITFWPPLPLTLTNTPVVAVYPNYLLERVGIEDLTINLTNSTTCGLYFQQTWGCWIKGVEIVGSDTRQMWLDVFNMGEVRDCYTHGTRSSGPGHEGIDLYGWTCWNLVEDNLASGGGFPAIILGDGSGGCAGNVIAYNYVTDIDSGSSVAGAAFSVNHGPHNMFNLFEGNVGQMFQSDGYFGSASHNTIFRNHFSGAYPAGIDVVRAIDLCRWSYYFNIVGNVLGTNDRTFYYATEVNNFSSNLIYRLGYPNMGNMSYTETNPPSTNIAALDINVQSNVLQIANYDYATPGIVNPTNSLPSSLYLSAVPAWWGNLTWPPIGSDLTPMLSPIPAQARYAGERYPYRGANVVTNSYFQNVRFGP